MLEHGTLWLPPVAPATLATLAARAREHDEACARLASASGQLAALDDALAGQDHLESDQASATRTRVAALSEAEHEVSVLRGRLDTLDPGGGASGSPQPEEARHALEAQAISHRLADLARRIERAEHAQSLDTSPDALRVETPSTEQLVKTLTEALGGRTTAQLSTLLVTAARDHDEIEERAWGVQARAEQVATRLRELDHPAYARLAGAGAAQAETFALRRARAELDAEARATQAELQAARGALARLAVERRDVALAEEGLEEARLLAAALMTRMLDATAADAELERMYAQRGHLACREVTARDAYVRALGRKARASVAVDEVVVGLDRALARLDRTRDEMAAAQLARLDADEDRRLLESTRSQLRDEVERLSEATQTTRRRLERARALVVEVAQTGGGERPRDPAALGGHAVTASGLVVARSMPGGLLLPTRSGRGWLSPAPRPATAPTRASLTRASLTLT